VCERVRPIKVESNSERERARGRAERVCFILCERSFETMCIRMYIHVIVFWDCM